MGYTELLPPLPVTHYVLGSEGDGYSPDRVWREDAYTADQLRAYALAAIAAAAPAIRRAERKHIQKLIKRRWKGGYPGEVVEDLAAAIRALPEEP